MVTKKKSGVGVVTEGAAQAALRRGPAKELSPEEDKVLRMRLGAAPARSAPLERAGEGLTDLEIELCAAEIEAYMRWKAREQDRAQVHQQDGTGTAAGQGKGAGNGIYGGNLMTVEERNQYRAQYGALKTDAERNEYLARHRQKMELRAQERGVDPKVTTD